MTESTNATVEEPVVQAREEVVQNEVKTVGIAASQSAKEEMLWSAKESWTERQDMEI